MGHVDEPRQYAARRGSLYLGSVAIPNPTNGSKRPTGAYAVTSAPATTPPVHRAAVPSRAAATFGRSSRRYICDGLVADIGQLISDARSAPESRHVQRQTRCPLSATSGHWAYRMPVATMARASRPDSRRNTVRYARQGSGSRVTCRMQ
jgi:hypothetical protein